VPPGVVVVENAVKIEVQKQLPKVGRSARRAFIYWHHINPKKPSKSRTSTSRYQLTVFKKTLKKSIR
jgi:hypothetical protein